MVSTAAVAAHLATLNGIGVRQVAKLARVHPGTVVAIKRGRHARVWRSTAEKILAVREPRPANGTLVSAKRSRHLLRLMAAEGFTVEVLHARFGIGLRALRCERPMVTLRTARRIATLYRRLIVNEGA